MSADSLRSILVATMSIVDDNGLAVRHLGGDPNRGVQIPGAPGGGSVGYDGPQCNAEPIR
jgi:inosine/xanthosine triphosphate pyrophosphatase family protein